MQEKKALLAPHLSCLSTAQLGWDWIQVVLLMSPGILFVWRRG